jgi:hypothetical protein
LLANEAINLRQSRGHELADSWPEEAGERKDKGTVNAPFFGATRSPSLMPVMQSSEAWSSALASEVCKC